MDRGGIRIRVSAARIHVDQGVLPAFQHCLPGRQVLPVPGDHHGRGRSARHGRAWRQKTGQPVLRPVLASMGDPRNLGCPVAGVPRAHVHQGCVPTGRAHGAAMPACPHRQVLGAVRGQHFPGGPPSVGRGPVSVHVRARQALHSRTRPTNARGFGADGLRDGSGPP